ncbi:MAG: MBL fold metallo-hydrolase [Promethearchaeota archaeon]|jgi:glyoxylase-like metal-dependent hydrolase (beta-lactamase superfamily II)
MNIKKLDFESLYFDLYELHSGIFAAISYVSSNAGFFDFGNYLIIFDSLMDPYDTDDLLKASKQFTNKEPTFLINSHYHMDHLFGNRKFSSEVPIISSSKTLLEYQRTSEERLNQFRAQSEAELKRIDEELKKETDQNKILEMKNDIKAWNEIMSPTFKLRPPDIIINDSIVIKGADSEVELIYIGEAHTTGDLIGYFEKEKICFMGDLLFEKTDPSWASRPAGTPFVVSPRRLRDFLQEYSKKNIEVFVPGHGNLCTKKELQQNIEFIEEYFIKN